MGQAEEPTYTDPAAQPAEEDEDPDAIIDLLSLLEPVPGFGRSGVTPSG